MMPAGPTLDPLVTTEIWCVPPEERIAGYARAHGDEIAKAYERGAVIVFSPFAVDCDLELIRHMQFPQMLKKVGTVNGIDLPVFARDGGSVRLRSEHLLFSGADIDPGTAEGVESIGWASLVQHQVSTVNAQIHTALARLLPRYHSLDIRNITWRFTPTVSEPMHIDSFKTGHEKLRIKMFINVDAQPRIWHLSHNIFELMEMLAATHPEEVAAVSSINEATRLTKKHAMLEKVPYHRFLIPPGAAVLGNAEIIAHQAVYGRRLVVAEGFVDADDMLDPAMLPSTRLKALQSRLSGNVTAT